MRKIIRKLAYRLNACALILFFGKGGADMMAMLWAQAIMLKKKTFSQTPPGLVEQVRELLIDSDCEHLITKE